MNKRLYILFLIPFIAGIFVVIFQFLLNKLDKEEKELTYQISNAISVIDSEKVEDLDITVNNKKTNSIYHYQVVFENSGQIPLKDLAIKVVYNNTDSTFTLFNYSIQTKPEHEFGKINTNREPDGFKLSAALINPGDKIFLSLLTNLETPLEVYSKSEGMILTQSKDEDNEENKASIINFILAVVISIMSTYLAFLVLRRSIVTVTLDGLKLSFDSINKAKDQENLTIISASYGKDSKFVDITEKLNSLISENGIHVIANNQIAGDPCPGVVKELKLVYSVGKDIETIIIVEGEELILSK